MDAVSAETKRPRCLSQRVPRGARPRGRLTVAVWVAVGWPGTGVKGVVIRGPLEAAADLVGLAAFGVAGDGLVMVAWGARVCWRAGGAAIGEEGAAWDAGTVVRGGCRDKGSPLSVGGGGSAAAVVGVNIGGWFDRSDGWRVEIERWRSAVKVTAVVVITRGGLGR